MHAMSAACLRFLANDDKSGIEAASIIGPVPTRGFEWLPVFMVLKQAK
jgi:hypothetical protein